MADSLQRATTDFVVREQQRGPAFPLFDAVRRALADRGWNMSDLHRESGVARSTVNKWETQPRPPLAVTVLAVARALGMDERSALALAGLVAKDAPEVRPPWPRGTTSDETIDELQAQLDAVLAQMSPDDRARWRAEMAREEVERLERWRRLMSGESPISDQ